MPEENDRLNHLAYRDVCDCSGPSMPDNEEYMECYRFWYPLGEEDRWDRMFENDDCYY